MKNLKEINMNTELEKKLDELLKQGATAAELASIRDGWGPNQMHEGTWLHAVVHRRLLPLVTGGATAAQLASVRDDRGRSALSIAACKCLDDVRGGVTAEELKKDVSARGTTSLFYAVQYGQAQKINDGVPQGSLTDAELAKIMRYHCRGFYLPQDFDTLQLLMELGASKEGLRGYIYRCRKKLLQAAQAKSPIKERLCERLRLLTRVAEKSGMEVCHPANVVEVLL